MANTLFLSEAGQAPAIQPVEAISELGKFFENLWNGIVAAIPTILFAIVVLIVGMLVTKLCLMFVSKGLDRLQKSKHNSIDETVTRFVKQVVKIVLYGSYARGTFDAESDIDIAAIVKGEREELQRKLREVWVLSSDLELEYETILSPTVIPYEEFEKYRNALPYYRNIEEEGIDIVE